MCSSSAASCCTKAKSRKWKTGEGQNARATCLRFSTRWPGRGVHIVTVNDYLARRDAEWMSPLYKALGLSVGVIVHDLDDDQRRAAYGADITYGTNNEFGFDYLRDNMKYDLRNAFSADTNSPSSTKWTPSSSTRRAPR